MHDIFSPSFQSIFDRDSLSEEEFEIARHSWLKSPDSLAEAFRSNTPVIIEDYVKPVPSKIGLLHNLSKTLGTLEVKLRAGDVASPVEYSTERIYESSTLSEYLIEMFEQHRPPQYAGNIRLPRIVLSLAQAALPDCLPAEDLELPSYWLGGAGCITPLHKDSTDNFAIQVFGRKRWTIFPVRDVPYLYLSRLSDAPLHDYATSLIDWRSPDTQRFPLAIKAHPTSFELRGGELLYLPAGWSHFVETIEPSLMINSWMSRQPFAQRKLGWKGSEIK